MLKTLALVVAGLAALIVAIDHSSYREWSVNDNNRLLFFAVAVCAWALARLYRCYQMGWPSPAIQVAAGAVLLVFQPIAPLTIDLHRAPVVVAVAVLIAAETVIFSRRTT